MDNINTEYLQDVRSIQVSDNVRDLEKSMSSLSNIRNIVLAHHPEFIDSIKDIDYHLACGAYRINNVDLFEQTVQKHYYDDYRFKKLYQSFKEMETANVWNGIVKKNANDLERKFVRSLSVVILTCVCLSLVFRK